jgi:D-3-phosphoglycerate dehydrogenase
VKKIVASGERFFMKFRDHIDYFKKRAQEADAEIVPVETNDEQAFQKAVRDASAIVVIDRRISAETIRQLTECEHILALSVGFDCVDVEAATRKRIPVSNVPAYCTDDVANHAIVLLLSMTRKIPLLIEETKAGRWDYNPARKIFNYREKTLGIIGLGKIGRALVPKAKGFGLTVTAYDPYLADDIFELCGVHRWYELDDMLSNADYVSIHAPLTQETYHLVDNDAFDRMKDTAYIVNTARGKIIHEEALYRALRDRKIAGAGVDVLETEPLKKDNMLLSLDNIIVTPHIAWYSEESFSNSMVQGCDETVRVLNGLRPRFIVNPEIFGKESVQ